MSKVATVSKFNTIGIFDAIDYSYKEDTSNIISTMTSKGRLSCVASDSSNNNIYVGASNLSIYVFNKQLKHTGTVDLSEMSLKSVDLSEMSLKSLTGAVVLERDLLVCDKDGKMAYIVTNQKQPKLQRKIDKSGFEGNEYYPMDVCTDNDGFIFILWAPTIPDNGDQIVVKYSQDGSKLLSQQKMEQPVDCITIMKTCHDKDTLVAACRQSCKMSLYAMADPYDNDVPSSCSSKEIHQSLNIPIDNNKSRHQDSGSTIKPTQGVKDKHPKRHLDNDNDGSKKRKVVSDSQSVPRSTNPHTQDARCKNPVEKVTTRTKFNIPNNRSTSALVDLCASTGCSSTRKNKQPGTKQTVTSEANVSRFLPSKQQQVLQDSDIPIAKRDIGTTYTKSGVRMQQGNREITLMGGKSSQAPKRTYSTASNGSPLSSGSARNTDVKKNQKEDATSSISNMPAQGPSGEPGNFFHTEVRKQQGNREITLMDGKPLQAPKRTYPTASNRSQFNSSSARNTDVKKNKKEDATSAIPNMPAQRPSGEPVNLSPTEQISIPTFDIDGN
ncbi:hypothetical protein BSL78_18599 [Apostichopus japonicus]|uniref:Uncharacterized protein n=1 Tax=Stichopus japonicus TaxID=307972 RepID=A0A2G8K996_STIJA|nr:hypothetical protein BSL78_18599 [Apostichopus japonicus]